MSSRIFHTCHRCRGTGTLQLTGVYLDTLFLLRAHPGLCGREMAIKAGCRNEAMCNRLQALKRLGYARCIRNGVRLIWRPT